MKNKKVIFKSPDGNPHLFPWGTREQPKKTNTPSIDKIDYQLKVHSSAMKALEQEKTKIIQKFKIQCISNVHGKGCGKMNPVGKLTKVIETYDDYECGVGWGTSNNTGELGFYCLHCGHKNRVFCDKEKFQYDLLCNYAKDSTIEHTKSDY